MSCLTINVTRKCVTLASRGMEALVEQQAAAVTVTETSGTVAMTRAVGTQLWMAPEVFFGESRYGPEVDVYSYGVILWELVTRETPWAELNCDSFLEMFEQLNSALRAGKRPMFPEGFETEQPLYVAIVRSCWSTNPLERPRFESVVRSLEAVKVHLRIPMNSTTLPDISLATSIQHDENAGDSAPLLHRTSASHYEAE
eukprot:m.76055 g.76055  ORF g.76055 m.76055 type:complete len:199 (-) comp10481_c0_seq2:102-698(-)